jgi:hypothetical protein
LGIAAQQSESGQEQLGLSGSGFADDADAFLGLDLQRHAGNRFARSGSTRKADIQPIDAQS